MGGYKTVNGVFTVPPTDCTRSFANITVENDKFHKSKEQSATVDPANLSRHTVCRSRGPGSRPSPESACKSPLARTR